LIGAIKRELPCHVSVESIFPLGLEGFFGNLDSPLIYIYSLSVLLETIFSIRLESQDCDAYAPIRCSEYASRFSLHSLESSSLLTLAWVDFIKTHFLALSLFLNSFIPLSLGVVLTTDLSF
jgi:hypothetical protein